MSDLLLNMGSKQPKISGYKCFSNFDHMETIEYYPSLDEDLMYNIFFGAYYKVNDNDERDKENPRTIFVIGHQEIGYYAKGWKCAFEDEEFRMECDTQEGEHVYFQEEFKEWLERNYKEKYYDGEPGDININHLKKFLNSGGYGLIPLDACLNELKK